MGNLKFINKVTLVYLAIFLIVVFYGYLYFIKPAQGSINEKLSQLDTLGENIKTIQAQTPAKIKSDKSDNNNRDLSTKVFDPYQYGFDLATGNAFFLDALLKKVKNTQNKVIEFSFSTQTASGNISVPSINVPAMSGGLNKQLGSLFINGNTGDATPNSGTTTQVIASLPLDKTVIKLEMVSTYGSMQNLLESLFAWEYLVGVNSIEISDEKGSGGKLRANLEVELYVKTKTI
jgi:hypothetical protein